jgi:hypothetical protein
MAERKAKARRRSFSFDKLRVRMTSFFRMAVLFSG